jgi:hypothetical protein
MSAPWYETVALLVSHINFIWSIGVAVITRKGNYFNFPLQVVILACAFVVSLGYHNCASTDFCLGLPLLKWIRMDYLTALGCVVVLVSLFINYGIVHNLSEAIWCMALDVLLVFVLAIAVIICIDSVEESMPMQDSVVLIGIAIVFMWVKVVVVCQGHIRVFTKFVNRYSVLGLVFFGLAIVCFVISSYYWFFHSLWHMISQMAFTFFIYGATRDVARTRVFRDIKLPY